MNIQQFRQSLREKWLQYYHEHREWLVKLGIWVEYDGIRRPTSSFIIATVTLLEPRLTRLMPLVVDLSSSPDRVVVALGLNFNPDEAVADLAPSEDRTRLLPSGEAVAIAPSPFPTQSIGISEEKDSGKRVMVASQLERNRSADSTNGAHGPRVTETNDAIASQLPPYSSSALSDRPHSRDALPPLSPADDSDHPDSDNSDSDNLASDDDLDSDDRLDGEIDGKTSGKGAIANQDEQCSGRQSHDDTTIWR